MLSDNFELLTAVDLRGRLEALRVRSSGEREPEETPDVARDCYEVSHVQLSNM